MISVRRLSPLFAGALLCLLPSSPLLAAPAASALVTIDESSGTVLSSFQGQRKVQVGSLTKIATAMVVLDWAELRKQDLNTLATVPAGTANLNPAGNGVGFAPGDRCSLRDLLYAALLQSDNAAAQTLAEYVGQQLGGGERPEGSFVRQMNSLAQKLGMLRTEFTNAHGLENGGRRLPFSTAEDMARLANYAMERSAFRFYVSQKERTISIQTVAGATTTYSLHNTNELLGVQGIDGVKTGTTPRAGACVIISSAKAPESRQEGETHYITPRRLNVVVLGSADRFNVARAELSRGWALHEQWVAAGRPKSWKPAGGR